MYAEERRHETARLVRELGRCSVADLAIRFAVTTETIRRDLSALEASGLVRRVHGGVLPSWLTPSSARSSQHGDGLSSDLARLTLEVLPPAGSTVLVDAGDELLSLAEVIPNEHPLTIVTPSIPVALAFSRESHIDVHLLPGRLHASSQACLGAETIRALADIRADLAVVVAEGVSAGYGCSARNVLQAEVKAALAASATRTVIVADEIALGREMTHRFLRLDEASLILVSDRRASERAVESAVAVRG